MKIKINNKFFSNFNEIKVNFSLDAVASRFEIKGTFNPYNKSHREIFRPLSFNLIEIYTNFDKLIFTGYVVNHAFESSPTTKYQPLTGYSKPGILEDSNIPQENYPLERLEVSLDEVARSVLNGFPISYRIDPSAEKQMQLKYEKVVANADDKIKDFLSKLASQRNIVISHDFLGNLVFLKPNVNARSKAFYNQSSNLKMTASIGGQNMHSTISVIRQPSESNGDLTPVDVALNSMVKTHRPITKILSDGTETDTKTAADNILASELKNIVFAIVFDKIDTSLECGDIVTVQNPEIYLYGETRLMIHEIEYYQSHNKTSMTLKLLLPEAFSGENPRNIFA